MKQSVLWETVTTMTHRKQTRKTRKKTWQWLQAVVPFPWRPVLFSLLSLSCSLQCRAASCRRATIDNCNNIITHRHHYLSVNPYVPGWKDPPKSCFGRWNRRNWEDLQSRLMFLPKQVYGGSIHPGHSSPLRLAIPPGQLKMRERKMQNGQKSKGGKCRRG